MVRFIHAADLRLGLVHRFHGVDARALYAQARFDVLRTIGELAADEQASFVVVAGDVFATNHVRPRTVARALEALGAIRPRCICFPAAMTRSTPPASIARPRFCARGPPT